MLLLKNGDSLRLITSSASALDVHASFVDLASGAATPDRANASIATAATTTVVSGPAAGSVRTVKTLTIRNRGAGTQVVTVALHDGSTLFELFEATLGPDTSLQYHEAAGWWVTDSQGREAVVSMAGAGTPVADADSIVRLTADVTNNNATANTMQDVTGLSFPVLANRLYWFEFNIVYTAAATTTGARFSLNGPAAPTYINYQSKWSLTATTSTENNHLQAYDSPAAANASSATTGNNRALMFGVIQPAADGTVIARFASEVASSAIVAKVNSFLRYRQITP